MVDPFDNPYPEDEEEEAYYEDEEDDLPLLDYEDSPYFYGGLDPLDYDTEDDD